MKYAHLADLHLGSWRDPKMRELSTKAFLTAMDQCLEQNVDFILLAGDIFNTSLPSLDTLKIVTKKLKELYDKNIPVYAIAGSHDYSPSGKTMIEVLEEAGLLKNVCKGTVDKDTQELHLQFTIDKKTSAKITGIVGKKGQLDRYYYHHLHLTDLEKEPGYKIFLFHTTIAELKPKHLEKIDSEPVSFLPKGFNYYAGGHIHHPTKINLPGYGTLTYPGALFPNNFAEIEKYSPGGYYLVEVESAQQSIEWIPVEVIKHHSLILDCNHKLPEAIAQKIINYFETRNVVQGLVTIRLKGTMARGKEADIHFGSIFQQLYDLGAYFIMKNTSELSSEEFEEIKIAESNPAFIEEQVIKEHLQQIKLFDKEQEFHLTTSLLASLNTTKKEGETVTDFQKRVEEEIDEVLEIESK